MVFYARRVFGRKGGTSLEDLYKELVAGDGGGLSFHNAMDDVLATWSVLEAPELSCELQGSHVCNSVMSLSDMVLKQGACDQSSKGRQECR